MTTVNVTIEGLAIFCFNPGDKTGNGKRCEIGFLRHDQEHELKIIVTGGGETRAYNKIAPEGLIEITSEGSLIQGYKLNDNGGFDRQLGMDDPNDPFDLRWILDMEGSELHNQKLHRNPHSSGHHMPITKMYLSNAYFYTERKIPDCVLRRPGATNFEQFGWVGDTLGARIDAGKATLNITDEKPLSLEGDTKYEITITNIRRELPVGNEGSDFSMYYDVLESDNGEFNLRTSSGLLGPAPIMCNAVKLGRTETIDDIFLVANAAQNQDPV